MSRPPAWFSDTDVVALDCEMVGVSTDSGAARRPIHKNAVCRVSVVSGSEENGFRVRLDEWVEVDEHIVDFRTRISGVCAEDFAKKKKVRFTEARRRVLALIRGRIVVGHALWNDFEALRIDHPPELVRDTALFARLRPFWRQSLLPSLRLLVRYWFQEELHLSTHDSIEDATAALRLYVIHQVEWEYVFGNRAIPAPRQDDGDGVLPKDVWVVPLVRWPRWPGSHAGTHEPDFGFHVPATAVWPRRRAAEELQKLPL